MKKLIYYVFLLPLLVSILYQPSYAQYEVKECQVYVNGTSCGPASVEVLNGRAFVPISEFRDIFGFAISWDSKNQVILVEDAILPGDTAYSTKHYWWAIMVNSFTIIENNPSETNLLSVSMDEWGYPDPPLMGSDNKVYVPLRLFIQIMGGDVDYKEGSINFNLPQQVLDEINNRKKNSAAGSDIVANQDLVDLLTKGLK